MEKARYNSIEIDSAIIKDILDFLNGYTWYLDSRPMKDDNDINPDVLGYIFEKYINQKELGAYYTKEDITEYISKNTIIPFILDKLRTKGFNAPEPNPMITNNEDIISKIGYYIENIDNYEELKYLYKDVLLELSVLDPAVGSGAFLFAALKILLPIYQKVVFKLKALPNSVNDDWLKNTIKEVNSHPEEYFLTKQIILNNLYGVDIVEEATEICKLRLFLQLASHLPDITSIEPLPDIDFNIYAGNSLVGGLSWENLENNYTTDLFTSSNREHIKYNIEELSKLKQKYRFLQQQNNQETDLVKLKNDIDFVTKEVNASINIDIVNPMHWFIDFNKIICTGGFDVIIGNPPYVSYNKNKDYKLPRYDTIRCKDLYAFFIERSNMLINKFGRTGMIIPISIVGTEGYSSLRKNILDNIEINWFANFAMRPGKLFEVDKRLTIWLGAKHKNGSGSEIFTTKYLRWWSDNRPLLFEKLIYLKNTVNFDGINAFPKISYELEHSILEKISKHKPIKTYFKKSGSILYHTRKLRNFVQFLDKPPYSIDENGKKSYSSKLKKIYFENEVFKDAALALFNSNLFFWYFIVFSDCRNVNKREVANFPFDYSIIDNQVLKQLASKAKELMQSLHKNSVFETKNYKKIGQMKVKTYSPRKSKHLMDQIDKMLGKVYELTDEEIDFVINNDNQFRMGEKH